MSKPITVVCGVLALGSMSMAPGIPALAACKMARMAELPVTMAGLSPLVDAKINGKDVRFIVDSGAFFSMIGAASAAELNLKLGPAPYGMYISGLAGRGAKPSVTTVETFTLSGIPVHNIGFFVSGSLSGLNGGSVGLLGQNVFGVSDVEYDFASGKVRFIKVDDCQRAMLAYWVPGGQPYSVIDIDPMSNYHTHITGRAYLNGAKIGVIFDTGAPFSILSLRSAARADVDPKTKGVVEAGYVGGVGYGAIKSYIGVFSSFKVGDEEVQHAKLRFGGSFSVETDMLIGADFFLSHRVYLAASQNKLYFTYNGGAVFNLQQTKIDAPAGESADARAPEPAAGSTPAAKEEGENLSAADYALRGSASAARRDFVGAIADLSRACELASDNAEYFFQRGVAYLQFGKPESAVADFDHALQLNPNHVLAMLNRAELRIKANDFQGARADLDAADRLAAKEADIRLQLAQDYIHADQLAMAITQLDTWLLSHKQDRRVRFAWSSRCWARALQNEDLDKALSDCDAALRGVYERSPGYGDVLGDRGFVRYRMGRYDKALSDYDDALKLDPKDALAMYGRGLAKIRLKKTAEGEADIAQALKMQPGVADQLNRLGVTP